MNLGLSIHTLIYTHTLTYTYTRLKVSPQLRPKSFSLYVWRSLCLYPEDPPLHQKARPRLCLRIFTWQRSSDLKQNFWVTVSNASGFQAVHYAAKGGQVPILEILKESNCNLKGVTNEGLSALHYAVRYDQLDAVKWLVEEGELDVSCTSKKGSSALDFARDKKKQEIAAYLESVSDGTPCQAFWGISWFFPSSWRPSHSPSLTHFLSAFSFSFFLSLSLCLLSPSLSLLLSLCFCFRLSYKW